MTIARLSSRASAAALPLRCENRNMPKSLMDRLRDTPCDRRPFTPDHAHCICRLANAAADEIDDLREALRDILPYAQTCVPHPISVGEENVIDKARRLSGAREEWPSVMDGAVTPFVDNH